MVVVVKSLIVEINTGVFCKLLGPVSPSQLSLDVTPLPPRSIPNPAFPKIELCRTALPVPDPIMTPAPPFAAMMLAAPVAVPPIRLFDDEPDKRIPPNEFG